MTDQHLVQLQGRIISLELLMRAVLTTLACQSSTPRAHAERLRDEFLLSLQHLDRGIGEYEDAVWAEAAAAMRSTFDQVIQRIVHHQERGLLPPDME